MSPEQNKSVVPRLWEVGLNRGNVTVLRQLGITNVPQRATA